MNTIFLLIFLLPLGLALWLIVRGIRGFRVGDHPVCRRCGFDLFGLPTKTAVCGECGADLRRRKAVCVGHHRLRRTQLGAGSFLLIVILGVAGGVGYGRATHVNWWNHAPLWCLLRAASSADGSWRRPAVAELTSRYNSHTFSATEMDRITITGLAYQRDVSKPWDFAWGDLIEKAHTDGKLSAAEWQQYLSQALDGIFSFQPRKQVRRGDPLPYRAAQAQPRTSKNHLQITVSNQNLDWSNGTRTIKSFSPGGINTRAFALQAEDDGGWIDPFEIPSDAPDGMQTLCFREHVEIRLTADDRLPPECSRDVDLTSSFNLLPAGQSSVKLIRDPNMKSAILKSMILKTRLIGWSQNTGAFRSFDFQIQGGPPIALAFDVFVKLDGKEISEGSLSFAANEADGSTIIARGVKIRWPLGKPATVDVILRSDPGAAVNSVDTFECWDGELVFKNVPVK